MERPLIESAENLIARARLEGRVSIAFSPEQKAESSQEISRDISATIARVDGILAASEESAARFVLNS